MLWLRLMNQPEALCVPGFAFSTRREVTRSRKKAPGRCLPGGPFRVCPGRDAPGRTRPAPRCPRAQRGPLSPPVGGPAELPLCAPVDRAMAGHLEALAAIGPQPAGAASACEWPARTWS